MATFEEHLRAKSYWDTHPCKDMQSLADEINMLSVRHPAAWLFHEVHDRRSGNRRGALREEEVKGED